MPIFNYFLMYTQIYYLYSEFLFKTFKEKHYFVIILKTNAKCKRSEMNVIFL